MKDIIMIGNKGDVGIVYCWIIMLYFNSSINIILIVISICNGCYIYIGKLNIIILEY